MSESHPTARGLALTWPEEPPFVPDRWRAGWGPDGVDPQIAGRERRQAERQRPSAADVRRGVAGGANTRRMIADTPLRVRLQSYRRRESRTRSGPDGSSRSSC
jgi:hypothetical protein